MNEPKKHHYIPSFYLKQWAGADRQVCQMRKVLGRVSALRKFPTATGFKIDLYKIDGVPENEAQQFESVFLKLADNDADRALQKLSNDVGVCLGREAAQWMVTFHHVIVVSQPAGRS